jgi:hypothetical protein
MIEIDNQTYPSEVRKSQPVQLETQEIPAGSSEFPGLSEEIPSGRKIIAGAVIETDSSLRDLDTLKAEASSGLGLHLNEGETYDGNLADPSGSGLPLERPEDSKIILLEEDHALQAGETDAAREMLLEMKNLYPNARVLRFVRYPLSKRIVLLFTDGSDTLSLQRLYGDS